MISLLEPKISLIKKERKNNLSISSTQTKIKSLLIPEKGIFQKCKNSSNNDFDLPNIQNDIIGIIDNKYYLLKEIGKGLSSKVYLGLSKEKIDNNNNLKYYSIKVINPNKIETSLFKNEIKSLENIEHINILKIYSYGQGILKKIKNGKRKEIYYIVMEYLEHGQLLNYITKISNEENDPKGFGENLGRIILSQILDGLEEIHNKNIFHRDIKLENIMLGGDNNNYILKYVDFGFSTNETGLLNTFLGTPSYAAPELHLKFEYYAKSVDIFSLGICLFIIVTGSLPFKLATFNDTFYQYFMRNDYVGFWKQRRINVSPNFMELFNNMCAFDYSQRPSISEIRQSAWMKDINYELLPFLNQELFLRENLINKIENEDILKQIKLKSVNNNKFSLIEPNPVLKNNNKNNNKSNIIINMSEKNIKDNNNIKNVNESNKGFISVRIESKNYNVAITKLKKFFKNKGYLQVKRNYNEYELEISNGEIDIVLKLEKYNNIFCKLYYYKLKGMNSDFDIFKKIINILKDKLL